MCRLVWQVQLLCWVPLVSHVALLPWKPLFQASSEWLVSLRALLSWLPLVSRVASFLAVGATVAMGVMSAAGNSGSIFSWVLLVFLGDALYRVQVLCHEFHECGFCLWYRSYHPVVHTLMGSTGIPGVHYIVMCSLWCLCFWSPRYALCLGTLSHSCPLLP